MNWKFWNKRYYIASCYTLAVILIAMTYWFHLKGGNRFNIMPIVWPFIIGLSLAYLLNFLLIFFDRHLHRRWLSLILVYLILFGTLLGFVFLLGPQIANGMTDFTEDFPDYSTQLHDQVTQFLLRFDLTDDYVQAVSTYMDDLTSRFVDFNKHIVRHVTQHIGIISSTFKNIALGVLLSAYVLAKKELLREQFKSLIHLCVGEKKEASIQHWFTCAHHIFSRFLLATMLNSAIIGVLTTFTLFIFQVPFALLIGFIVALTNVIPIFGPIIGAIPSAIMIFFISPAKAGLFVILILVIQQLDANIITPKIVGDKMGIASIWVLVSILIFGHFAGVVGMVLALPTTAFIFEVLRHVKASKTRQKTISIESSSIKNNHSFN